MENEIGVPLGLAVIGLATAVAVGLATLAIALLGWRSSVSSDQ